ncbi:MAG TPA: phosphoribosylglycinamide formyltransferase [Mycobacteriales bacterium]|nr:phosphoribosylglycinamide formyltransferase [Mycobacteriales bacterium]
MIRIAILASGAGTTAEAVITACRDGRILGRVVTLIGNNSRSEVFARARRLDVVTRHLSGRTHPDPAALDTAILDTVTAAEATHIVLAGYLKKLGPRTLAAYTGRILNTHPALLPEFGGQGMYGRHVHEAVLRSGAATTGATVHHVEAEYDTGPAIARTTIAVLPDDTADRLAERVQRAERELLVRTLADIAERTSP